MQITLRWAGAINQREEHISILHSLTDQGHPYLRRPMPQPCQHMLFKYTLFKYTNICIQLRNLCCFLDLVCMLFCILYEHGNWLSHDGNGFWYLLCFVFVSIGAHFLVTTFLAASVMACLTKPYFPPHYCCSLSTLLNNCVADLKHHFKHSPWIMSVQQKGVH